MEADESFSAVFPTIEAAFLDKPISDSLCGLLSSSRSKRIQSKKASKVVFIPISHENIRHKNSV